MKVATAIRRFEDVREPGHPASDPRPCIVAGEVTTIGAVVAELAERWWGLSAAVEVARSAGFDAIPVRVGGGEGAGGLLGLVLVDPEGQRLLLEPAALPAAEVGR